MTVVLLPAVSAGSADVPLLQHSAWWLLPGAALALAMVYAMMECVAAFMATQPRNAASSKAALFARLLALADDGHVPASVRLEPGGVGDLDVRFDPVDPEWRARFARVRLTTQYHARLVLDEERHQIRWFEVVRSSGGFIGFRGLVPQISWGFWLLAGYIDVQWTGWAYGIAAGFPPRIADARPYRIDTVALKRVIRTRAGRAGWGFRPKVWWFQVRRRRDGTIPRGLIPSETRWWSERAFWGVAYPLLYILAIAYIAFAGSGWPGMIRPDVVVPVLAFSALWWVISGFIAGIFWLVNRSRQRTSG